MTMKNKGCNIYRVLDWYWMAVILAQLFLGLSRVVIYCTFIHDSFAKFGFWSTVKYLFLFTFSKKGKYSVMKYCSRKLYFCLYSKVIQ